MMFGGTIVNNKIRLQTQITVFAVAQCFHPTDRATEANVQLTNHLLTCLYSTSSHITMTDLSHGHPPFAALKILEIRFHPRAIVLHNLHGFEPRTQICRAKRDHNDHFVIVSKFHQ